MSTTQGSWSPAAGNTNTPTGAPAPAPVVIVPPPAPAAPVDTRTVQGKWTPLASAHDGEPAAAVAPAAPRTGAHVEGTWTPAAATDGPRTPATGAPLEAIAAAAAPAAPAAPAEPAAPATPATGAALPEASAIVWATVDEGFRTEPIRVGGKGLERAYMISGTPGAWTLSAATKGGASRGSQVAPAAVGDADHAKAWAEGVIRAGWAGGSDDGA